MTEIEKGNSSEKLESEPQEETKAETEPKEENENPVLETLKSQNYSRSIIKSIIDSKELSDVLELKLGKYKNALRKLIPNKKYKDYISKLEEGYESSDSGDSVQSTSTVLTSTTSSTLSGLSYISGIPNDVNALHDNDKDIQQKGGQFSKLYNEINMLKTEIPKEKRHDINNNKINNEKEDNADNKSNEENFDKNEIKNKKENKIGNLESAYPLEYFEIFPYLNKYKIGNEANNVFIEKPILFVKNLILKNYHESLTYTQNKFQLQNFKNSPGYRYNIMNKIEPDKSPPDDDIITCMILGYYQNINTDKKNENINKFNNNYKKLQKQLNDINFIFFGYKNGLIRQNVLVNKKPDMFSFSDSSTDSFFPYREFPVDEIITEEKLDKHVLFMSLSDKENYLLAGYASGHIIIWSNTNGKSVYVFDDIFDMPVIACEFLSVSENEKEFHILVSDLIGKVYLIQLQKNLIRKDVVNKMFISNCTHPCLLVKKLRFNKNDGNSDFKINEIIKNIDERPYICIIGNLEYIEILSINRKPLQINSMLIIQNPDFNLLNPMTEDIKKRRAEFYSQTHLRERLSEIQFPDACFGLGYLGDLYKNNENNFPHILLVYSWKNMIKLYLLNDKLNEIVEIGWYLNNSPIIKIDFIDISLLYLLDKNNNIKIINTKLFNPVLNDKTPSEKDEKKQKKNKFLIPISDIISIENPVRTISKTFTETINFYSPFITKNKNNIYLIEEISDKTQKAINNVRHIHLLSFEEFFSETTKDKYWLLFFCKFIDIIKTGTNTLGNIPENKENKEKALIEKEPNKIVKNNYLKQFLTDCKKELNEFDDDEDELDAISNHEYLSVALEFAIEIGSIDFIYNEIKEMENKKTLEKELVEYLEKFILNNKFQNDPNLISEKLINDIINHYFSGKSGKTLQYVEEGNDILFKLDLMLCHLHIDIVKKIKNIEKIIVDNKLSCSLIYYYSNGLNDFIKPLNYLFSEFSSLKPKNIPKENFKMNFFKRLKMSRGYYRDNYYDLLKSLKSGLFNLEDNLFKSKEFMGHLLLFYIQLTLKEFLFPNLSKIDNLYELGIIIPEMFLFLTKKEVAEELIKFDSYSYFETLTLFFFKEEEMNMMINDEMFETYLENNLNQKNKIICPLIIENIDTNKLKQNIEGYNDINNKKDINKETPKHNNSDKIILIESKEEEKNVDESIKSSFLELVGKIMLLCNNLPDNILIKFDMNLFIIYLSLKIDGISNDILKSSLLSIFNFYNDIKKLKLDFNGLSSFFEKIDRFGNHYTLIRRKQSTLDSISSILNFFIYKYYISQNSNKDEINNLFKTIFTSYFLGVKIYLYELKKDYVSCINVYLNEKKKISRRVFTFINKTLNLLKQNNDEKTLQIYKNEIKKKVTNLARVSQSETFKIIQKWFNSIDIISSLNNLPKLQFRYIDKLKSIYKRRLKREKDLINDNIKKEYSEILLIYIKLLFYFDKEKRVLKLLKDEEEFINVNECLKICINKKSVEAAVYLYKYIGDEKNALKTCLDRIKQNYNDIKKFGYSIDERNDNLFKEMKLLIDESIDICENYSENLESFKKRKNSQIIDDKNLEKNQENHEGDDMGEEYWLEVFGKIYEILNDCGKSKGLIINKIKTYLSEKIENLLITMNYYVSFNFILKSVSHEVEFSLIKNFLNKNIYTKSHLSNLYKSYINLISYKITKDVKLLQKNGHQGKRVNLIKKDENQINSEKQKLIINNDTNSDIQFSRSNSYFNIESQMKEGKNKIVQNIFKKCTICNLNLENGEIIIFKCEHIYHIKCLTKEYSNLIKNFKYDINLENNFCPKCININTELFSFINENKNENLDLKDNYDSFQINNIENQDDKGPIVSAIENRKKKMEEKFKKRNFKKLTLLDNNYFEQINILENTLDGI